MKENYAKMMTEKCQVYDKILKSIQTNENFCIGNELTFIDIQLVSLYIFSKDVNVGHEMEKASPLTLKVDLFGEKTAQFGVLDRDEHYQQEPENQRVRR